MLNQRAAAPAHHRRKNSAMLIRVSQQMVAEREQLLLAAASPRARFTLAFLEIGQQPLEPALQQIFLVVVVRIKGRAPDVCAIDDLLHRDRIELLLLDQREQRRFQELLCPLYPSIRFFRHYYLRLSEHSEMTLTITRQKRPFCTDSGSGRSIRCIYEHRIRR